MAVVITPDDLAPFMPGLDPVKAQELIAGALAAARLLAPCLKHAAPDSDEALAAKDVIVGAIVRKCGVGNSAAMQGVDTQSAGPFSVKYIAFVGGYSDREERKLRQICRGYAEGKAFVIDGIPDNSPVIGSIPSWGR